MRTDVLVEIDTPAQLVAMPRSKDGLLEGPGEEGSNSPFMKVMKETWVPRPDPSPFR